MKRLMSGWLLKPSYGTGKSDAKFRVNVCRAQRNVFPGQFAQTHETSSLEALYCGQFTCTQLTKRNYLEITLTPTPTDVASYFFRKLSSLFNLQIHHL